MPKAGLVLESAAGSRIDAALDGRQLFPDHSQYPPGTCRNAGSECKPIEFDPFQAMCHSSAGQDGKLRRSEITLSRKCILIMYLD